MIKPQELRIGNLIQWRGINGFHVIIVTSKVVASLCGWHTPINLNPEWLLRLGFEEGGFNMGEYEVETYKLNGFTFSHASFGDKTLRYKGELLEYPQYVHQLQNLYFALTGEELTIKETV